MLMVADYAERWPADDLATLLGHAGRQGRRVRVLLVARPAGVWWQALANRLDRLDITVTDLPLRPLGDGPGTSRTELFTAACGRFATALDTPSTDHIAPPAALEDDEQFGLVLAVHMAALAAVDAHRTGNPTEDLDSPGRIAAYLLNRERDHWQTLHANRRTTTDPAAMTRAVFTAALTGTLTHDHGTDALTTARACPPDTAATVLADHATAYPPATPHTGTVLEPLYPDRLAEDFPVEFTGVVFFLCKQKQGFFFFFGRGGGETCFRPVLGAGECIEETGVAPGTGSPCCSAGAHPRVRPGAHRRNGSPRYASCERPHRRVNVTMPSTVRAWPGAAPARRAGPCSRGREP
ncbi:hypothetical protein [Streptomyces specialis]|uniref:hypothetical protein n=1 Tax=Streptomyces specialis TaxID=498367 RepID=UPI00131E9DAE|nr:hypothetical protein [Streptomyces specialis]